MRAYRRIPKYLPIHGAHLAAEFGAHAPHGMRCAVGQREFLSVHANLPATMCMGTRELVIANY